MSFSFRGCSMGFSPAGGLPGRPRHGEKESRPRARFALDPNAAAVEAQDLVTDRQPQPRSFVAGPSHGTVHLHELIEKLGYPLFRDPRPVVAHADLDLLLRRGGQAHQDLAAGVAYAVVKK